MFSSQESARASDALRTVTAGAGTPGVPEGLSEFAEVLNQVDLERDRLDYRNIMTVLAAWQTEAVADFYWRGGFVLGLRDGRKAYLGATRTPVLPENDDGTYNLIWDDLDLEFLPSDFDHAKLSHRRQPDPRQAYWLDTTDHLNEFLRKLTA